MAHLGSPPANSAEGSILSSDSASEYNSSVLKENKTNAAAKKICSGLYLKNEAFPYNGLPYLEINNGIPFFAPDQLSTDRFASYSELDSLDRCGAACAIISRDTLPTGPRKGISRIHPTGWHSVKYGVVPGKYLFNRCHLIGYQLTGENANAKNLITGTRHLNIAGMLPFEDKIAKAVKQSRLHVLYRITPIFEDENLVASGVLMEALSLEDKCESILFCVFCYNIQPGIEIDYATGESREL